MTELNKIVTAIIIIIPIIISVDEAFGYVIAYISAILIAGIAAEYLFVREFLGSDKRGYKLLSKITKCTNKNKLLSKFKPSPKMNERGWLMLSIVFPIYFVVVLYLGGFFSITTLSQPSLNGQFVNFYGITAVNTVFGGCGNGISEIAYLSSPSTIIDGNAIDGNLTLISVGNNVTICNNTGFPINLNVGIYPDFKQLNLTFIPFIASVRINSSFASFENGIDIYGLLKNGNAYYKKSITITLPNSTGYLYSGEYSLTLNIEAIYGNMTFYPNTLYHLFTVNGVLGTSRNFLTNFNIYLKIYSNQSNFCKAQPSYC